MGYIENLKLYDDNNNVIQSRSDLWLNMYNTVRTKAGTQIYRNKQGITTDTMANALRLINFPWLLYRKDAVEKFWMTYSVTTLNNYFNDKASITADDIVNVTTRNIFNLLRYAQTDEIELEIVNTYGVDKNIITDTKQKMEHVHFEDISGIILQTSPGIHPKMYRKYEEETNREAYIVLTNQITQDFIGAVTANIILKSKCYTEDMNNELRIRLANDMIQNNAEDYTETLIRSNLTYEQLKIKRELDLLKKTQVDVKLKEITQARKELYVANDLSELSNNGNLKEELERSVIENTNKVDRYQEEIRTILKELEAQKLQLLGLATIPNEVDENLTTYVKQSKELYDIRYEHGTTNLIASFLLPLKYWNKEQFLQMSKSQKSNIITDLEPWKKDLFTKILDTQSIELLINSGTSVNIRSYAVTKHIPNISKTGYGIPNPHHYYYDCYGANKNLIINACRKQDYLQAVVVMQNAAASLNIPDLSVLRRLVEDMPETFKHKKCLIFKKANIILTFEEYKNYYKAGVIEQLLGGNENETN